MDKSEHESEANYLLRSREHEYTCNCSSCRKGQAERVGEKISKMKEEISALRLQLDENKIDWKEVCERNKERDSLRQSLEVNEQVINQMSADNVSMAKQMDALSHSLEVARDKIRELSK